MTFDTHTYEKKKETYLRLRADRKEVILLKDKKELFCELLQVSMLLLLKKNKKFKLNKKKFNKFKNRKKI